MCWAGNCGNAEAALLLLPCFWGELVVWELDMKRCTITCLPVTSSRVCFVEGVWRTAGNCTKGIQANPTCCCTRTSSPSVWCFSHKKRSDTEGSLVLILLAANCSLYFSLISQETCRTCRVFYQLIPYMEWCTPTGWWDKSLPPNFPHVSCCRFWV